MVSVSVKLKADASTYVEYFNTLPTWEGLTSRIVERFNIPPQDIAVGYINDADYSVILTHDRGLQKYYKSLDQSSKIKFVVLDRQIPNSQASIIASWPSDFELYELSNSVSLFCWVFSASDNDSTDPFSVVIRKEKAVDDLKKKIQEQQKHTFAGIDSGALRLWKLSPPIISVDDVLVKSPEEFPGCTRLNAADNIGKHFPSPPPAHIHIIVQMPTPSRKRFRSPEEAQASKKIRTDDRAAVEREVSHAPMLRTPSKEKEWSVCGTSNHLLHYHVDPAEQAENQRCLESINKRDFCLLTGSRASGKTTRLFRIRNQLSGVGIWSIYYERRS